MKLDLKKLVRSRDTWVVIGGAAAAVTAIAVVSGRGNNGNNAGSAYGYPGAPAGQGDGSGSTEPDAPITPSPFAPAAPIVWPSPPIFRPGPAPLPVVHLPSSPTTFVDRFGNPATVEQIMNQDFSSQLPPKNSASASSSNTAAVAAPRVAAPRVAAPTIYVDRAGNSVTLEQLMSQTFFTNSDARQAPAPSGSARSVPAAAALFVEPIIASKIKTPGGGLAYPGGGVETYMGGAGSPLGGDTRIELAA